MKSELNNINYKLTATKTLPAAHGEQRATCNPCPVQRDAPATLHPAASVPPPAPKKRRGPASDRRTTWDRICKIDDWIRSGTYPTAIGMARRLGVTDRTVHSDISFLRKTRGLPVAFDKRRNGFYYTRPVAGFSKAPLTQADIFAILVAHKSVAQYRGTPFEQPLRSNENILSAASDGLRSATAHLAPKK
jgi:hypothetical protein